MLGLIRELIYKIRGRDNREYFLDSQTKESIMRFQKVAKQTLISSDDFAKTILEIKRVIF
jgi:hypothetical protein